MNLRHKLVVFDIEVGALKSGRFKVFASGVPDYHFEDWRGCNAHVATVPGQPMRGFETAHDAASWIFAKYENRQAAIDDQNKRAVGGTWANGSGFQMLDWDKKTLWRTP